MTPPVITAVPNLRDLGGHATGDGRRVRHGLLYRSDALDIASPDDAAAFATLGLRVVFDLRTAAERAAKPDRLPPGVAHVVLDVLADTASAGMVGFDELLRQPVVAVTVLGGGRGELIFERTYRGFVTRSAARAAYRELFMAIGDGERHPALFHCATGKDRTGWAAAALLLLLGVSEEDVLADYLRSNTHILPAYQPVFDDFAARGGDPAVLLPVLGVRREYLAAAIGEMRDRHGSVEGYFTEALLIGPAMQAELRELLTEPTPVGEG